MNSFLRSSLVAAASSLLTCVAFAATPPELQEPTGAQKKDAVDKPIAGTAIFSVKATANGGATIVRFDYGRSTSYGQSVSRSINADANAEVVGAEATGLVGGQTYHFRVTATNFEGSTSTPDGTFVIAPYAARVTTGRPTEVRGGNATLNGTITTNGQTGTVAFEYGIGDAFDEKTDPQAVDANAINLAVKETVTQLKRGERYKVRFVFENSDGSAPIVGSAVEFTIANNPPIARADEAVPSGETPVIVRVLANDGDPDKDPLSLTTVTQPEFGSAKISGRTVIYTPGDDFKGVDSFTYSIEDGFGGTASATVNIRSPRVAGSGSHSSLITDEDGENVGVLKLTSTTGGAFTGRIDLDGKSYQLHGTFDANGRFQGTASGDGETIAVDLRIGQDDDGASISASLDNGKWESSIEVADRAAPSLQELEGRYTIELPATNGTTEPGSPTGTPTAQQGRGWATIKLNDEGDARIRGKLGDGRPFSAGAVLAVAGNRVTLPLYDTPGDSLLVGEFVFGDGVTGTLGWRVDESEVRSVADGAVLAITANGGRYVPPEGNDRALENETVELGNAATITISGGDLGGSFMRQLHISDDDDVRVLDAREDELKLEIDRDSGIFQGKFRHPSDFDKRVKFSGVLLQESSAGRGVFRGLTDAGTVEFAPTQQGGTNPPPDDTDPDPAPNPNPQVPDDQFEARRQR